MGLWNNLQLYYNWRNVIIFEKKKVMVPLQIVKYFEHPTCTYMCGANDAKVKKNVQHAHILSKLWKSACHTDYLRPQITIQLNGKSFYLKRWPNSRVNIYIHYM